jgi:DNA modification methylase
MGSGTSMVVAKKLGRRYIGIEKEEIYFNIAKKRINVTKNNEK